MMSNVSTSFGARGRTVRQLGVCLAVFLVTAGGARAAGPVYSPPEHKTLTLILTEESTVTHTLTGAAGLSDGPMPQGTVLATGTFTGSAHTYGFRWESRDAGCGADLSCSRVRSLGNANDYIDMMAEFAAPATLEPELLGYAIVNLGTGTSGTYTLRHMTGDVVKAGTYRVQTSIGVYTP